MRRERKEAQGDSGVPSCQEADQGEGDMGQPGEEVSSALGTLLKKVSRRALRDTDPI